MQRNFSLNWYMAIKLLILAAFLVSMIVIVVSCVGGAAPTPTPTAAAKAPAAVATPKAPAVASPAAQASPAAAAKVVPGGNPDAGKQAIAKYGCGSCHTIPGVQGANGTSAPNLGGFANRDQIARAVPNTPDNLVKWIQNPQSVKPGTGMPTLGVSEADAKDIAAYLYTLK